MSYILDALRRADSERERGAIPKLHAKPAPADLADGDEDGEGRRTQPLLWAVIGLLLVLIAVLAWLFLGRSSAPEAVPVPVEAAAPPAPVVAVVAPPPAPAPSPTPTPTPTPVAPAATPKPPIAPPVQASQRAKTSTKPASAAVPASSVADERPVLGFADLPDHIRRELPQLVIGGAMYSQTPANRMLILNGQVFHEGDKIAGELVLEQIKLKSAVLAYKGYRYSINY
jgi:general secretion pathway protein B